MWQCRKYYKAILSFSLSLSLTQCSHVEMAMCGYQEEFQVAITLVGQRCVFAMCGVLCVRRSLERMRRRLCADNWVYQTAVSSPLSCCVCIIIRTYRMAWNVGGEVNLSDWRMYERTTKFNSTNDVYARVRSAWSRLVCQIIIHQSSSGKIANPLNITPANISCHMVCCVYRRALMSTCTYLYSYMSCFFLCICFLFCGALYHSSRCIHVYVCYCSWLLTYPTHWAYAEEKAHVHV